MKHLTNEKESRQQKVLVLQTFSVLVPTGTKTSSSHYSAAINIWKYLDTVALVVT